MIVVVLLLVASGLGLPCHEPISLEPLAQSLSR